MGMDVYGKNPTAPEGEYFRRNVWGWHPLADLCLELAPETCAPCEHWHSNDADGLDARRSRMLGSGLEKLIEDGTVASYIAIRDAALKALPLEMCRHCNGSGIRTDEIAREHGLHTQVIDEPGHPRHGETGTCNGCNSRGTQPHRETHYHLDINDVREFAVFLKACGGFEIC